jgi:hypothetical protein
MISYCRKRLVYHSAKLALGSGIIFYCAIAARTHHNNPWPKMITLLFAAFVAWRLIETLAKLVDSDLTALSWDNHTLRISTLLKTREVPLAAVVSVREKRRVWRAHYFAPVWTTHNLIIATHDNGSSATLKVPVRLLEGGSDAAAMFRAQFEGAIGARSLSPAAGGLSPAAGGLAPAAGGTFTADDSIAAQPAAGADHGFGPGSAVDQPPPAAGVRTFGRKRAA